MTNKRPKVLKGDTIKTSTGCGALYITVNKDDAGNPFEVKFTLGKCGTCKNTDFFILGVLLSVLFQCQVPYDKISKTLKKHFIGSSCDNPFEFLDSKRATCYDVIAKTLLEYLPNPV